MSDPAQFTIGPPHPVTDSRLLPVVTADDEGGFVTGVDLEVHPDNDGEDVDGVIAALLTAATPEQDEAARTAAGDEPATFARDDELTEVVAEVDLDDVDDLGFGAAEEGFPGLDDLDPAGTQDGVS